VQPSWCSGTRAVCALGRSGRRRLRAALSCPRPRPYPPSCPWGAGTNNQDLLQSPFYVGCKHERVRGDAYYELIDELMSAVKRRRAPRPPRRRRHGTAPSTCAGVDCWNPGRAASWDGGPCALLQRRRPSPARAGLATCASLAHVSCFSAATQTLRARRFGNTCLMHLEDMSFENLGRLFARYRGTFPCFSDDVQARAPPPCAARMGWLTLIIRVSPHDLRFDSHGQG